MSRSNHYAISNQKHLTNQEIQTLKVNLAQAVLVDTITPLEAIAIELLLNTGARQSELLNVTMDDFDWVNGTIFIRGLKGSDHRSVPVNSVLMEKTKRVFGNEFLLHHNRPFYFTDRHFRNIWYTVRPANKSLHSLRHTCAIKLYEQFRDLKIVQYLLGHRNINNTLVYSNYVFKTEELSKIAGLFKI